MCPLFSRVWGTVRLKQHSAGLRLVSAAFIDSGTCYDAFQIGVMHAHGRCCCISALHLLCKRFHTNELLCYGRSSHTSTSTSWVRASSTWARRWRRRIAWRSSVPFQVWETSELLWPTTCFYLFRGLRLSIYPAFQHGWLRHIRPVTTLRRRLTWSFCPSLCPMPLRFWQRVAAMHFVSCALWSSAYGPCVAHGMTHEVTPTRWQLEMWHSA